MKVIKRFRDKNTKVVYQVGDTYTHADPARLEFLEGAGYIAPESEPKTTEEVAEENELQLLTKQELFDLLDQRGIEYTKRMTKDELIDLLK